MSSRNTEPTVTENQESEVLNLTLYQRSMEFLHVYWRSVIGIGWPLFLLPFMLAFNYKEMRCAYVILIMAMFWITETVPLAVTSLLPVIMFPLLGILDSGEVCNCYMNDTIMVFIGGMILAISIEHCNLHLRIALTVMRFVGCSHAKLLGGICVVTGLIGMWVSNTASCAMMIPIIFAILEELEKEGFNKIFEKCPSDPADPSSALILKPTQTTKAYLLTVAYVSTFGGTSTLVGTGTNLILKGIYEQTFPDGNGISFTQWLSWGMPISSINIFLTWIYIQAFYLGLFRPRSRDARAASIGLQGEHVANLVIKQRYDNLGPMTFHEVGVTILFALCVILWVFRSPGFMPGWADLIASVEIKDSTPVILISILLFFFPKEPLFMKAFSNTSAERTLRRSEGLITWKLINSKMPWGLMILFGGGFAIARGSYQSCLSKRIGEAFAPLRSLPPFAILLIVCAFIATVTEITSNIGIANIMLPVIAQMSIAMEQHPLYLMVPATMCCSHAFRFPVGTPPNAIAAAAGHIPTKTMIIAGCIPAMYGFTVLILLFSTWGIYVFEIDDYPEWAMTPNETGNGFCD